MPNERFRPVGATVEFERYEENGFICFACNTVDTECPEPMINAMCGLKLLDGPDKRFIMTNMQEPLGLYPRVASDFEWEVEPLEGGDVRITFRRKEVGETITDFSNTHCGG